MENNTSPDAGSLIHLLEKEEQNYQRAFETDMPFEEVKPIFIKIKELKTELEELRQKTESLNERFAAEIKKYENAMKKFNDCLAQVKNV